MGPYRRGPRWLAMFASVPRNHTSQQCNSVLCMRGSNSSGDKARERRLYNLQTLLLATWSRFYRLVTDWGKQGFANMQATQAKACSVAARPAVAVSKRNVRRSRPAQVARAASDDERAAQLKAALEQAQANPEV